LLAGCSFHAPSTNAMGSDSGTDDSGILPPPPDGAHDPDAPPPVDAGLVDSPAQVNCPSDFTPLAGAPSTSRYKIYSWSPNHGQDQSMFVPDAEATCTAQMSHLAIADDAAEAAALAGAIRVDPKTPYFWDGVTDAGHEGTWLTVLGGTPAYLMWAPGQPNGGTQANCALMNGGLLYDWGCTAYRYPFACECE
jgi:hypothetical protein